MSMLEPTFTPYLDRFHQFLMQNLPDEPNNALHQAMRYSVLNGGKRLRPLLVYLTGIALNADLKMLDHPACAIELIHCYSLIHDDLPAMDNDDFRRGKPTCHKAFNAAMAILAGDALQTLAFEVLSQSNAPFALTMIRVLSQASGAAGMAYGQALDISLKTISHEETLSIINQAKTGCLIKASVRLGILAANCQDKTIVETLLNFAETIGIAYQIYNDIQDIEGNIKTTGRPTGSDHANNKITYPLLHGIEKAKQKIIELENSSISLLKKMGLSDTLLVKLTGFMLNLTRLK